MSLWQRMFSAVVCWALTLVVLLAVVFHYFPPIPQVSLFSRILWFLGVTIVVISVLVGVLALWMKVWLGKYW